MEIKLNKTNKLHRNIIENSYNTKITIESLKILIRQTREEEMK